MKSILDPSFKYVPSGQTDIRKTFAKAKKELQKQKEKPKSNVAVLKPLGEQK